MTDKKPVYVTDARGHVIVGIHDLEPRTLARVIAAHPESETLIRGKLQLDAPDALRKFEQDNG